MASYACAQPTPHEAPPRIAAELGNESDAKGTKKQTGLYRLSQGRETKGRSQWPKERSEGGGIRSGHRAPS